MSAPTVCDCGHPPTATEGCGPTGYATRTSDGATLCYSCADSDAAADISTAQPGHRVTHYLSCDGRNVTTWSGGVLMTRVRFGKRHPWSRDRHYVYATDVDGRRWSGTGAPGMYATLTLRRER